PHDRSAHEMQDREQLLSGEEAIGEDAHEERRHDGGNGRRRVRPADLRAAEVQRRAEVGPHGDEPRPPDEVLEQHHHGQPYVGPGHVRPSSEWRVGAIDYGATGKWARAEQAPGCWVNSTGSLS